MPRPKRYASEAEKQAAYRERKKQVSQVADIIVRNAEYVLSGEESVSETTVPGTEMASGDGDRHPVYPWLKRWPDREYDENGLVLKEQRCGLCNRTWSASIPIECPYCHGKGVKIP